MTTNPELAAYTPSPIKEWISKNLLALVILLAGGVGAVYLSAFRLEAVEKKVSSLENKIDGQARALGRVQLDVSVICAKVADDPLRDCRTSSGGD